MKESMKKFAMFFVAALMAGFMGCSDDSETVTPPEVETPPSITLEKSVADMTALTFKVAVENATTAAYVVLTEGEEVPAPEQILADGTLIDLRSGSSLQVKAEGLNPSTDYRVVAAAKNVTKMAVSNTLYMTTAEQPQLELTVEVVQVSHETMNFRFTAANAEKVYYLVMYADREAADAKYVMTNGEEVSADLRESVEVAGLECDKKYQLLVVASGSGQTLMHEPLLFQTEDDPDNVIRHEYTRARGSVYSGSAFVQFSYEDANEADNFAYDEQWLGLDFRMADTNEYLPAGTYAVTTDGAEYTLLSRYSTYGYDAGVELDSGTVVVSILDGAEKQYYKFEIDVYLKNGRHFVASYEGDVDGMPIKNTVYVTTNFTSAVAEKQAEDGSLWKLTLTDAAGNEAVLELCNAFALPYLAANPYTSSNAPEATDTEFGAGEFNGATSTFKVAAGQGEGTHKFATGTLHVDIDWTNEKYMMSLYATLENEVVVEAEYTGVVSGISLAPSTDLIELLFNKAVASAVDNDSYWTTYLSNDEGYEVRLVAECAPSPNGLPAGEYQPGVGAGKVSLESSSIKIPGEKTYYFTDLELAVVIDQENKVYDLTFEGKLEDGRSYKGNYVGAVDGMTIPDKQEEDAEVVWSKATAKHWYSDNWEITIADADEKNVVKLDMRIGDSGLTYIPAGIYTTFDDGSGVYIQAHYCTYNGVKMVSDAELIIDYDASTQEYELIFALALTDGRMIEGEYSGLVEGSPKAE